MPLSAFSLTALRQRLLSGKDLTSDEVIFIVLYLANVLSSRDGSESTEALSDTSDKLLGRSGLTTLERLLATALCAYNTYAERSFIMPNPLWLMYVEEQVRIVASCPDIDRCDLDVLDWACMLDAQGNNREGHRIMAVG
jgi:hypothetical protein